MSGNINAAAQNRSKALASGQSEILAENTPFKLVRRPDRANLEIIWRIDGVPGKKSAETADPILGRQKMDLLYRQTFGGAAVCPCCNQAVKTSAKNVAELLDDYWADHGQHQIAPASIRTNLKYLRGYLAVSVRPTPINQINEIWARDFRRWMGGLTYTKGNNGTPRKYATSTIEGALLQLHAAIKWAGMEPEFEFADLEGLSRGPEYRADVATLAKMFRFCLYPETPHAKMAAKLVRGRVGLVNYLRLAIATWGRPEALYEFSLEPHKGQWASQHKVLHLNPKGREQTSKRRPSLPMPNCIANWLDGLPKAPLFPNVPDDRAWGRMVEAAGCPPVGTGESGFKLIRRSVSELARDRLEEIGFWHQGETYLGHTPQKMSDIYASHKPGHLGRALGVTTEIMDEIEALCPGAFYPVPADLGANVVPFQAAARG